jgi:hypothetical protein
MHLDLDLLAQVERILLSLSGFITGYVSAKAVSTEVPWLFLSPIHVHGRARRPPLSR